MPDPQLSVLMAVYNGGEYLRAAMDSVLSQDFDDLEFVIVDDCSTDETPAIIASFGDPRVIYVRNNKNLGQTASLNVAIQRARGEFLARIDADDLHLPGKLRTQIEYLRAHSEIAVLGTWAEKIDPAGRVIGIHPAAVEEQDVRFRICFRSPVCHISVLMRRDPVRALGGFDLKYRYAADYALWSELMRAGCVISNLPSVLAQYREYPQSTGAASKAGVGGEESAAIIRENARTLAGVDLSQARARTIALMLFPEVGLSRADILGAYSDLRSIAHSIYGRVPRRTAFELRATIFWSLVRHQQYYRKRGTGWREFWRSNARSEIPSLSLDGWAIAQCARSVGWIQPHSLSALREMVLPRLLRS
jgi:cellulose synthase/poly-beta-1,6-N-acetylglucosamine synthase-like glycosyltransferase